jgi:glycogen debranching enzyme
LNFRLSKLQSSSSVEFREFVKEVTDAIGNGPRYLIPYFFSLFARGVHDQISAQVESRAVPWIGKSPFFRQLGVASYQFIASLRSAQFENYRYSFSAGHPHFSVGWSRSWGRDTFISFKGCMLLTGMIEPAKEILF